CECICIVASSLSRSTLTFSTPSTFCKVLSTCDLQPMQLIPSIEYLCSIFIVLLLSKCSIHLKLIFEQYKVSKVCLKVTYTIFHKIYKIHLNGVYRFSMHFYLLFEL